MLLFRGKCFFKDNHWFCTSFCCILGQQTLVELHAMENVVSNETNEGCTYVHWRIFILVDVVTLLYMDEVNWIALEECWFIYTRNKGMRYVRITLRCTIDTGDWIELQLHEKLSLERTKLWSVIPLFALLITPGGVNGNLCRHLAHQTAGGTIECHSCN